MRTGSTSSAKSRLDCKTGTKVEKNASRAPRMLQRIVVRRLIHASKSTVSWSIVSFMRAPRRSRGATSGSDLEYFAKNRSSR